MDLIWQPSNLAKWLYKNNVSKYTPKDTLHRKSLSSSIYAPTK